MVCYADTDCEKDCVDAMAAHYKGKHVDKVAGRSFCIILFDFIYSSLILILSGMESRGFIVGLPVAMALGVPFLMMRKPNKLPGNKVSCAYGLEVHIYGYDFG